MKKNMSHGIEMAHYAVPVDYGPKPGGEDYGNCCRVGDCLYDIRVSFAY
jgi:hypothetical protein